MTSVTLIHYNVDLFIQVKEKLIGRWEKINQCGKKKGIFPISFLFKSNYFAIPQESQGSFLPGNYDIGMNNIGMYYF